MFELTGKVKYRLAKRDQNGGVIHLKYYDEEDNNIEDVLQ